MPSDIQVFVRWKEQTIFAGEDVECTITFKNVAESSSSSNNAESSSSTTTTTTQQHPALPSSGSQKQQQQQQHTRKLSRAGIHNQTGTSSAGSDSFFSLKSPQSFFFNNNNTTTTNTNNSNYNHRHRRSIGPGLGLGASSPSSPRRNAFYRSSSHRTSYSLSSPLSTASHSFPPTHKSPSVSGGGVGRPNWQNAPGHGHKRSVSILSIDSDRGAAQGEDVRAAASGLNHTFGRPALSRGHGRSASMQVLPRRNEVFEHDGIAKATRTPLRSPQQAADTQLQAQSKSGILKPDGDRFRRSSRPGSGATSPNGPGPVPGTSARVVSARRPKPPPVDFHFPAAPPPASSVNDADSNSTPVTGGAPGQEGGASSSTTTPSNKKIPSAQHPSSQLPQLTRIMSTSSVNGSNRSSGEFYSISDNSSETLASEYTSYSVAPPRSSPVRHGRHYSTAQPPKKAIDTQTLLMGFAQVSATFTVDGSLINQSAFEEVKRKGVMGSQATGSPASAGAVVRGADKGRKSGGGGGGFWGALGWNAIEDSLSGLLAKNDLEGLRDMRGVTSSRSIPLLSTPQSLLFVDLRLGPGEEQSFSFSFTLPRGLPASHKGKAIKITYNLVIGTQRPSGVNEPQRVQRINVPFRVVGGVNNQGDILGHDLMSPYVILRDEARVQKVDATTTATAYRKQKSISASHWTSARDFLSFVDEILEQRSSRDTLALPPPNTPLDRRRSSSYEVAHGPLSCKDAIDLAILRSNQIVQSTRSPNRFEIARDGRRIAVVVLNRPSHRLGETIIATVDFADAALPCYALRATLETSEKVTPTLAVRSGASIHRATRRIHASFFENTLFSTRVVFTPAIPIAATPTILTSGVTLDWELRFEFVTPGSLNGSGIGPSGVELLESISEDDDHPRGRMLSALESLQCESFEIAIPLTVYGETVREPLPEEQEGYSI